MSLTTTPQTRACIPPSKLPPHCTGNPARNYTIGPVSDCPTVTVHARKRFKALIYSCAACSIACTMVYSMTQDHYKTKILPADIHLKKADGSSMSSLDKATLHLHTAKIQVSHTFIICDKLQDTDILFGIGIQKRYSLSHSWDSNKQLFI